MKNRKLLLIVSIVLALTMSLGGTLAYLTDSDADVNTMVLGNVKITQNEQQRVEIGNAAAGLESFEDGQMMLPAVYDLKDADGKSLDPAREVVEVNGYKITYGGGMRTFPNYMDKIVTVTNNSNTDAYIRTIIAVPAGLNENDTDGDVSEQWLHYNFVSDTDTEPANGWYWGKSEADGEYPEKYMLDNVNLFGDGKLYDITVATNKNAIPGNTTTAPNLVGLYLDNDVDYKDGAYYGKNANGGTEPVKVWEGTELKVYVLSQAVQASGFSDAWTAFTNSFGDVTEDKVKEWFANPSIDTPSSDWPSNEPVGDVWNGGVDTTWAVEGKTEYVLTTAEQLAGLTELVKNGNDFAGKTIKLDADLDLAGKKWTPIGDSESNAFEGNFDGQGHTISNLTITNPEGNENALFGCIANNEITGITVKNVDVTGYTESAAIVGYAEGSTISDCHVRGAISIVNNYAYTGGIVAHGYVNIENCSVIADGTGVIKSATRNAVGGIAGWMWEGNYKISGCEVANLEITGWTNVGCISGFIAYNNVFNGNTAKNIVLTKTREGGNPGIGLAAGGYGYNSEAPSTITNNSFTSVELNGESLEFSAYHIMHGSEYYGKEMANFVMNGNSTSNITNNTTVVK